MFKDTKAFCSFSMPDMAVAKTFYGETLGISVSETPEGFELHLSGNAMPVFVYHSNEYTAPEHTVLNFLVADIEATIEALSSKGISMEQYDLPGMKTDAKGIFRGDEGPKAIAWFKDPADHILSLIQE